MENERDEISFHILQISSQEMTATTVSGCYTKGLNKEIRLSWGIRKACLGLKAGQRNLQQGQKRKTSIT